MRAGASRLSLVLHTYAGYMFVVGTQREEYAEKRGIVSVMSEHLQRYFCLVAAVCRSSLLAILHTETFDGVLGYLRPNG